MTKGGKGRKGKEDKVSGRERERWRGKDNREGWREKSGKEGGRGW